MADPDPNDKVTLAGSGVLLHVQRSDGKFVPVQGTDAGAINTAGGGGGGTVNQGAPGVDPWATYNDDISSVIGTSAPAPDAKAFVVRNVQSMAVAPGVVAPGVDAQSVYLIPAGDGGPVLDETSTQRLGVVITKPIGAKTVAGSIPVSLATDHGALPLPSGAATSAAQTDGTQIAIAKGPIAPGAAVGAEKPVLMGGSDGTNAQLVNVDSTGAVRLQSGGTPGAAAPSRVTQVGGSDGTNLRAFKVDATGQLYVIADTELAAPAALADGTANPSVTSVGAFLQGYNGSDWDRVLTQNSRLVVSGNVANGGAAARPVTCGGVDTGANSYPFVGAVVGAGIHQFVRALDGNGNGLALESTQTNGNARVKIEGSSPTADATTGVYTRFPTIGTASTAFASGVAQMKTSAGRVRTIEVFYTGVTNSGLYVQLHAVNGTPTNATLVNSWPINAKSPRLTIPSEHDLPCPNGIALAFSSTEVTYTAAAAEPGSAIIWGA